MFDHDEPGMMISMSMGGGRGCSDYPHLCLDENREIFSKGIYGNDNGINDQSRFRPGGIWHGTDPEYV